MMNHKIILFLLTAVIGVSCAGTDQSTMSRSNPAAYQFTAKSLESELKNTGRGAATGAFLARVIVAEVMHVESGLGLQAGQVVAIKMKDNDDNCAVGKVCRFDSPYRHPGTDRMYLLDATTR
jgi:hypothetical protein